MLHNSDDLCKHCFIDIGFDVFQALVFLHNFVAQMLSCVQIFRWAGHFDITLYINIIF